METKADAQPPTRRILVKLSGEALMGEGDYGIDPAFLRRLATRDPQRVRGRRRDRVGRRRG